MPVRLIAHITLCILALSAAAFGATANDLRLVPFPKQAQLETGQFAVKPSLTLTVTDTAVARQASDDLKAELGRVAKSTCSVSLVGTKAGFPDFWLVLTAAHKLPADVMSNLGTPPVQDESYRLIVRPGYAAVGARTASGLAWGIQSLVQLVRANMQGKSLPCLTITDWPSMQYRGFMDDITRGPSSTLATLELESRVAALTKMNIQNYYIEHQYAFAKYPDIGPKDGSLLPEELKTLVAYAKARNVDIVGNQQSFGHWATILSNPKYRYLGETSWVLNPQYKETYEMLDNMYSEQAPLTESQFFNVDCDETGGLGTRANRDLVRQIGVGSLYVSHIKRLHDMLRDKYHKRMMMWGDIIIHYPQNMKDIPKDTMMLTWDYSDRKSYEPKCTPFEQGGFDYLVCPCVTCWSLLPDFGFANYNIKNFIRDGVKHGAKGCLNTTWDDDAEGFWGYYWHGIAWGAECSWNASSTPIEDFNDRIGAVLFGEKGEHFGKAITILTKTYGLDSYNGSDHHFWVSDGVPAQADRETAAKNAKSLLDDIVNPALAELRAAQKDAQVNGDQLDYFIFGAERMKCLASRTLALIDAADKYAKATAADPAKADPAETQALLKAAIADVQGVHDEHARLKARFQELWLREERPYAMDWTLDKYNILIARYDKMLTGLDSAQAALKEKKSLPAAGDIGL